MSNSSKQTSAWNKKQNKSKNQVKKKTSNGLQNLPNSAVQSKLQTVNKHIKNYESSSEEEELETDNLIGSILKQYIKTGGKNENLGRTKTFLDDAFFSGAAVCLICISRVKRENAIWSCMECFCIFHLQCIQRWSKDNVTHQKHILEDSGRIQETEICWGCPKCRHKFKPNEIPTEYECYCKKTTNPKYEPFLVPHSCGEICRKDLNPNCGHKCLLLCHPGPCPPCPVTVSITCYCGRQTPLARRCSQKEWSCGSPCGKLLKCGKHKCTNPCHPDECLPCPKKSLQKCLCKSNHKLRECATPIWQCEKVCSNLLDCGNHKCLEVCHEGGCQPCPLTQLRTCPCGKNKYQLPCTEETPTCKDTCGKLLECGQHTCHQRCHKDKCGVCLETVVKSCRCGQHSKEIQCYKSYLCETKCKNMKDCNKHPCNRKCCDGNCSPCEKPCGRTLSCGNHKCSSVCHRGPCYPCNQTETVTCRCGQTKIVVSCGRKYRTKPPKCSLLCSIPPDCHHKTRVSHKCHFGDCPSCKQICNKNRSNCAHLCPAPCHSAVFVKIEGQKASMPWEQTVPQIERRDLPCPDCKVPISVTCLGEHETCDWPCYLAKSSSCSRPCGRLLNCGNHNCSFPCHTVDSPPDKIKAGSNCEICEYGCEKERPEGCQHECPKPCHPGPCPPCKNLIRIKCHCGLNQPYVSCNDWLNLEKRIELQCCGNQCPKNYKCGHRCRSNCHPGECPNSELCKKKVKITCKCKRIKKEFQCETVRNNLAKVDCDEICLKKQAEEKRLMEKLDEEKRKEEELLNQKELAKYEKFLEGKSKIRERRIHKQNEDVNFLKKYKILVAVILIPVISIALYFISF